MASSSFTITIKKIELHDKAMHNSDDIFYHHHHYHHHHHYDYDQDNDLGKYRDEGQV